VIIIDSAGVIQYRWVAENPGVEPNYDEVVAAATCGNTAVAQTVS
jgi:peroxiredoxin